MHKMSLNERIARLWFRGHNTAEIARTLTCPSKTVYVSEADVYNRLRMARYRYQSLRDKIRSKHHG